MPRSARWLVVVNPGRLDLYQHLAHRLGDLASIEVLLDRRRGERRRGRRPAPVDLRQGDRRRPLTAKAREQWGLFGYRLASAGARGGGRARAPPPARLPPRLPRPLLV